MKRKRRTSNAKRKQTKRKKRRTTTFTPSRETNRTAVLNHNVGLLSPHKIVSMRYADTHEITSSVGPTVGGGALRLNGIFDPDTALGGGQPRGHDQMNLYYNKYKVLSCTITVRFKNMSATSQNGKPYMCLAFPGANFNDWVGLSSRDVMERYPGFYKTVNTQLGSTTIKWTWSGKKWFDKSDWESEFTTALFGADPSKQAFLNLGVIPVEKSDPGYLVPAVLAVTTMDFKVMLFDPKPVLLES
ncbi:MAG TPA: hypothetical protein EYN66_16030 [Myxococcales bacterium]|nr:hypothetical protein [Myxococcales bacterium]